jgi:hypothetical protein
MNCVVCALPVHGDAAVHPSCVPAGVLRDAVLSLAELLAVVATPVVVVWAG